MVRGNGWNLWVWLTGSGCGCNLWVCLVGVVVRRHTDFLILLILTPPVCAIFCSSIPTFVIFLNVFRVLFCNLFNTFSRSINTHTGVPWQLYEGLHVMFYT